MLPIGSKITRRVDQWSHQHTQGSKIDQRSQQFHLYKLLGSCGLFCNKDKGIITQPAGSRQKEVTRSNLVPMRTRLLQPNPTQARSQVCQIPLVPACTCYCNQPSTMPDCKGQPNMLRHVGTRSAAWQKTLLVSVKRKSLDRRSERTRLSSPAQDKTRVGQIQLKRSGQIVRKFLVKPTMAEQISNEMKKTKRCQLT